MSDHLLNAAFDILLAMHRPPNEQERELATAYMAWQAFCNDHHYTVIVQNFMFGQYRIQLCDSRIYDPGAPPMHGGVVQQMCTYHRDKAEWMTDQLYLAKDPLAFAKSFATPTNCEFDGGRIRLDDDPDSHPAGYRRS